MFDTLNDPVVHFVGQSFEVPVVLQICRFGMSAYLLHSDLQDAHLALNEIIKQ